MASSRADQLFVNDCLMGWPQLNRMVLEPSFRPCSPPPCCSRQCYHHHDASSLYSLAFSGIILASSSLSILLASLCYFGRLTQATPLLCSSCSRVGGLATFGSLLWRPRAYACFLMSNGNGATISFSGLRCHPAGWPQLTK